MDIGHWSHGQTARLRHTPTLKVERESSSRPDRADKPWTSTLTRRDRFGKHMGKGSILIGQDSYSRPESTRPFSPKCLVNGLIMAATPWAVHAVHAARVPACPPECEGADPRHPTWSERSDPRSERLNVNYLEGRNGLNGQRNRVLIGFGWMDHGWSAFWQACRHHGLVFPEPCKCVCVCVCVFVQVS